MSQPYTYKKYLQTTPGGGEPQLWQLLSPAGRCHLHAVHGILHDTGDFGIFFWEYYMIQVVLDFFGTLHDTGDLGYFRILNGTSGFGIF